MPSFRGIWDPTFDQGVDAGPDAGVRAPPDCLVGDDVLVPVDLDGIVVSAGGTGRDEGFGFAVGYAVASGVDTFVRFRLLDECGQATGDEVDVDATGRAVAGPVAAMLSDGGFVVSWSREDAPEDGEGAGVLFHRYDLDGVPRGGTELANQATFDDQLVSSAASLPDGFALAWEDYSGDATVRPDAMFRTFDATGDGVTDEENMNISLDPSDSVPILGAAPDGQLLLCWSADGLNARGRRRTADGAFDWWWPFAMIDYETPALTTGAAGSDGGFAGAVTSFGDDFAGDVDLVLVPFTGDEPFTVIPVSDEPSLEEFDPLVAALPDGGWFFAWTDRTELDATDTSGTTVMAERFDSAGVATDAAPFVVPTTTDFDQDLVALTAGAGGVLVVWLDASGADGDRDGGLRARLIPYDFVAP